MLRIRTKLVLSSLFVVVFAGFASAQAPKPTSPSAPAAPAAPAAAAPKPATAPATPPPPSAPAAGGAAPAAVAPGGAAHGGAADHHAAAGAAEAMPPATPPPELDTLFKPFEGSWRCETRFPAGAMAPGAPEMTLKTSIRFRKDLNNFWYRGEYESKKTKTFPGMKGTLYMGYDPVSKQATLIGVDSMGGWGSSTAASPQGESITFVGEMSVMGHKMKTRETLERRGPKEVYHRYEADMGKGFQLMGEDTCKK